MCKILITDEMRRQAETEYVKRKPYINVWFNQEDRTTQRNHIIGFLGEFCLCSLLGIDWRSNIRLDYSVPDECDLVYRGKKVDIKTETVKTKNVIQKICSRAINENEPYGCRLINENQVPRLNQYDIVVWGLIDDSSSDWYWHFVGWVNVNQLYGLKIQDTSPNGKIKYPTRAMVVPTNLLNGVESLIKS